MSRCLKCMINFQETVACNSPQVTDVFSQRCQLFSVTSNFWCFHSTYERRRTLPCCSWHPFHSDRLARYIDRGKRNWRSCGSGNLQPQADSWANAALSLRCQHTWNFAHLFRNKVKKQVSGVRQRGNKGVGCDQVVPESSMSYEDSYVTSWESLWSVSTGNQVEKYVVHFKWFHFHLLDEVT